MHTKNAFVIVAIAAVITFLVAVPAAVTPVFAGDVRGNELGELEDCIKDSKADSEIFKCIVDYLGNFEP